MQVHLEPEVYLHQLPARLFYHPFLFSLYTNCCFSSYRSVKLLQLADKMTLVGLIPRGDESASRGILRGYGACAQDTTLSFTLTKQWKKMWTFADVLPLVPCPSRWGPRRRTLAAFCVSTSPEISSWTRKTMSRLKRLREAVCPRAAEDVQAVQAHDGD